MRKRRDLRKRFKSISLKSETAELLSNSLTSKNYRWRLAISKQVIIYTNDTVLFFSMKKCQIIVGDLSDSALELSLTAVLSTRAKIPSFFTSKIRSTPTLLLKNEFNQIVSCLCKGCYGSRAKRHSKPLPRFLRKVVFEQWYMDAEELSVCGRNYIIVYSSSKVHLT